MRAAIAERSVQLGPRDPENGIKGTALHPVRDGVRAQSSSETGRMQTLTL